MNITPSLIRNFCLSLLFVSLLTKSVIADNNFSASYETKHKVIAIGDIHGAYQRFYDLLTELQLINEQGDWSGGNTYLVSLGDLLDRGAESRKVIDLVIKLQKQAKKSGGNVIQVLGNHELMVTTGDLRYVSKEEFSAFAQEESKKDRKALLSYFTLQHPELSEDELTQSFVKEYPPGYVGFVKAFSPQGEYGKWLREAMPLVKVNDSMFAHGGLSSALNGKSIQEINSSVESVWEYQDIISQLIDKGVLPLGTNYWTTLDYLYEKLQPYIEKNKANARSRHKSKSKNKLPKWTKDFNRLVELHDSFPFSDVSPMWYRGNAYCHPYSESFNMEKLLKQYNAKRIVIGHSPLYKTILSRMNEQVILADTGMLAEVYRGNATALRIHGDEVLTYTLGKDKFSSLQTEKARFSVGSSNMTDAEIEDFLLTGKVINSKKIGVGINNPKVITLEKNGKKIKALHKIFEPKVMSHRNSKERETIIDRYQNEIAAYRLDRILGLRQVPVAVERKLEGSRTGLLQYWVEDLVSEAKISDNKIQFSSQCPKLEQYRTRYIFDVLIYNDDRNDGNIVFSKNGHMLYLIDHTLAFSRSYDRPKMYRKVSLQLSNVFRQKLIGLKRELLDENLADVLSSRQLKAILKRRDLILEKATTP